MKIKNLILFICLIILTSCSTIGSTRMLSSSSRQLKNLQSLNLKIVNSDRSLSKQDSMRLVLEIKSALLNKFTSEDVAKNVRVSDFSNGEVNIDINLITIKEVSGTSRVMWGALAGRNKIEGRVSVTSSNGQILEEFFVVGESASHPFSGKFRFSDAVEEFSYRLVNEVKN